MNKEDLLFGQYLIRFSKKDLDMRTLEEALTLQEEENKSGKYRKIGTILFQDFQVFNDLDDLLEELENFQKFKREYIE